MSNLNMLNSHRYKVNQINLWRENFKIDYGYIDFYDEYSDTIINKIYDLITNDKIDDSIIDPIYNRYIGYYYYLKDNLEEMKKYFKKGIVKGDSQSIVELAKYHIYIDKDKSKSINLLRDAINLNNQDAMFTLAIAYNNNMYDDEEYSKKEATQLFNKLIDLKHHETMNYLGNFYLNKDKIKSKGYFTMMNNTGYIYGNFGLIKLGVSKAEEKELLAEIILKWDTNRCTFPHMGNFITVLYKLNYDLAFLVEHSNRLGFENSSLRIKIQAQETVLKNKMKYKQLNECPVCFTEKELIPFDCFGHFHCLDCDAKLDKCSICRISRNQLLNFDDR